jgi:hypothetical protein
VPAAQSRQVLEAAAGWKVPALQFRQSVLPDDG